MVVKKSELCNYSALLLAFLTCFYEYFSMSKFGKTGYYAVELILVIVIFFVIISTGKSIKCRTSAIVWIPFLVLYLYQFLKPGTRASLQYLLLLIVFLMLLVAEKIDYHTSEKVIAMFFKASLFYAFGVYFQVVFPSITNRILSVLLSEDAISQNIRLVQEKGYYPGFTHQVSHTALYLLVGLVVVCFSSVTKRMSKTKKYASFMFLFIAFLLQGKRAHLVFILFSIVLAYMIVDKKNTQGRMIKVIGTVLFVLILVNFASPLLSNIPVISRLTNTLNEVMGNSSFETILDDSGRLVLYDLAIAQFMANPFTGIGWGNFSTLSVAVHSGGTSVHNVYLQLLCETGIIGLSCFLIGVISSFILLIKTKNRIARISNIGYKDSLSRVWCIVFTINIFTLLYCFTENPIYNEDYFLMYMFSVLIVISIRSVCEKIEGI